MSRWLVVVALTLTSGCTAQRYLVLPPSSVVAPGLPETIAGQTWRLGEISTRVEVAQMGGGAMAPNVDVDRLKEQLTERVRSTLTAQKGLGAVEGPAVYSLEVELTARENYGFGKGFGLGLGLEIGTLLAGAAAGAVVGAAIDSGRQAPYSSSAYLGASVGVGVAAPIALMAALLTEIGGVRGEYGATLTLRRRADRVPVASRKLSSSWKADYNSFSVAEKIAKFSGDAVPEFERVLLEGVKSMLLEVNEPLAAVSP